uniref:CMP/dCMP-type deaminase domain-containing protein n=1 Tax=Hydatigena taeniaeformis TaxID=6205 RepID=A0A0R3WN83_HYDTA
LCVTIYASKAVDYDVTFHVDIALDVLVFVSDSKDFFLGFTHYRIDRDKELIMIQENIESERITEAVNQLKASKIDASLASLDYIGHKSSVLSSNRGSLSGGYSDGFVQSVEQLAAVLEPSNWCQRGHSVPAWCINVEPLSSMSSCISVLARIKPLPKAMGHVKRAFVRQLDQAKAGKVLLGLVGKRQAILTIAFTTDHAAKLVSKLCLMTGISKGIMETCRVPLCPPRSCRQQKVLTSLLKGDGESRSWPFNFHPNQNLESLLSSGIRKGGQNECDKPYFSVDEIKWHNHWLRRAIDLARSRSNNVKNASCDLENPDCVCTCVVVRPHSAKALNPIEAQPLVEAVSTDAESHIDHATMLAVCIVGRYALRTGHASNLVTDTLFIVLAYFLRINRELRHAADEDGNAATKHSGVYLLTDCDVYLSTEPCLMCAMALLHSRVKRVFIARRLPSIGGLCSRWKLPLVKGVNHHFLVFAPCET